jgi:DnaK suppressor protein
MSVRKQKLYSSLKKSLSERRETLARDLREATANFVNEDESYSDALDQAAADVDKSLAVQMKNRERGILLQIDEALRRIDNGSYGECQNCGDEIAEARMRAFPFTTLCVDCKAEIEAEGNPRMLSRVQ